ncbi:MAG: cupin [Ectothiorhodospiraceae bacterium]|nr:cupin [Chromatiales bacterium]MCP5154456.1 cupin [Ectothiorhodospiraceae bacterium]
MALAPGHDVPNNPQLPVVVHRRAVPPEVDDVAGWLEARFAANGWVGAWRDGVFDHHHYHATAHEVLGIARGSVEVMLGGAGGVLVTLGEGDVAVLPAGTGHCRVGATSRLVVVGAYPSGQSPDLRRAGDSLADAARRIARVPVPDADPVQGADGALVRLWTR